MLQEYELNNKMKEEEESALTKEINLLGQKFKEYMCKDKVFVSIAN